MKQVNRALLIAFLMTISFFCGKFFASDLEKNQIPKEIPRVFIEQLKTKLNITKNRNDIEIFLNGTKMTDDIKLNLTR